MLSRRWIKTSRTNGVAIPSFQCPSRLELALSSLLSFIIQAEGLKRDAQNRLISKGHYHQNSGSHSNSSEEMNHAFPLPFFSLPWDRGVPILLVHRVPLFPRRHLEHSKKILDLRKEGAFRHFLPFFSVQGIPWLDSLTRLLNMTSAYLASPILQAGFSSGRVLQLNSVDLVTKDLSDYGKQTLIFFEVECFFNSSSLFLFIDFVNSVSLHKIQSYVPKKGPGDLSVGPSIWKWKQDHP